MDRWNEIEARFEKALALTPEERAAYLDNLETHDPELHREVMSLLAAHEDAPDFFVGLSGTFVAPFLSHLDKEPSAPSHVGPYRVVQELGHGGMSTVYLAERADGQFEQHVALKLVRADVQTDDRLQRFRGERQILASLNHPSVARLLDGGITDDGRPYLVMEYVDGLPINRYCDAHLLSLEDRLRLFQHVVEAVQYAHRNLVVHRDLKPSNILVTEEGKVKLLDFGIAKLLDDEAGSTALTQTGERWMSPEYAAPEQIKGHRITTATDVYQLGVTLYKLLTGHRPYRIATTSTYEIERAVCEAEPTRPSSIVGQVEETRHGTATVRITPESISQTRAADLPVLQRKLSGDLDAIILKALRKEPEHRYASAEAFCEDLKRYLNGLPVLARRGSVGYRARKYVERNRWSIAAIAAIMLLLIGYAVTVTLQAEQIARERDRARLEAFKTEEVNERMIDLFSVSDANEARRDRITAREILEEGTRRVRKELGNQPEVQAEALSVIGRIYERLGFYDESVHLMDSALSIRRQVLRAPHLDLAEGLHHLGTALKNAGHYDQAEQTLREAVRMWNALPAFQKHAAKSMVALGRLLADKNDFATADSLYRATLAIQRALGQEAENDLTKTLSETALLVHNEGDYAAAESLYHETLALQRKLLGENHPDIVTTLVNLAGLYLDR
ncbi:MAG: protein kinase, partial [Rhodothermales bacterium]